MPNVNLLHDADVEDQNTTAKKPQRAAPATTSPAAQKLPKDAPPRPPRFAWLQSLLGKMTSSKQAGPRILEQSKVTMSIPPGPGDRSAPRPPTPPPAPPRQSATGDDSVLEVNLVPSDLQSGTSGKNYLVRLAIVAVAALCAVAVVYLALSLYQARVTSQAQSNQAQIQQVEQRLSQLSAKQREAVAFHKSTLGAMNLLSRHLYWTKFFRLLEQYTLETVSFHGITADRSGRVTLSASAKSFRAVAEQLIVFEGADDFVQTVSITSASAQEGQAGQTVEFSASLTLVDDVFYRSSDSIASTPSSTTQ